MPAAMSSKIYLVRSQVFPWFQEKIAINRIITASFILSNHIVTYTIGEERKNVQTASRTETFWRETVGRLFRAAIIVDPDNQTMTITPVHTAIRRSGKVCITLAITYSKCITWFQTARTTTVTSIIAASRMQ